MDALREHEIQMKYKRLADNIDKYLESKDSLYNGMYLSRKEYEMCSKALRQYSTKKGFKDVIKKWFTKW